jgi:hypothetical protein
MDLHLGTSIRQTSSRLPGVTSRRVGRGSGGDEFAENHTFPEQKWSGNASFAALHHSFDVKNERRAAILDRNELTTVRSQGCRTVYFFAPRDGEAVSSGQSE